LARRLSNSWHHPETLPVGKAVAVFHRDRNFLTLVSIGLAIPIIITYLELGIVPRLPTAVLSMGLMILAVLSISSGLVLDTVTRARREMKLLAYLSHPPSAKIDAVRNPPGPRRWTATPADAIPLISMSDLSLTILPETANDAQAIERLHERTFGPGRFVLSAYRLREHVDHLVDLSFTARIGTLLVGSVRQLPILIGDTKALLLGPLTVEPPFRGRGIGRALLDRALKEARARGHRLVVLIGDEPYYGCVGFKIIPKGRATMPGPVDYSRLLVAELVAGAFTDVSGAIRPDWSMAK
jgi:predicted N-acetyltransferase YhbS